jgi:hypothetical protein
LSRPRQLTVFGGPASFAPAEIGQWLPSAYVSSAPRDRQGSGPASAPCRLC